MKKFILNFLFLFSVLYSTAQIPAATWAYIPIQKGAGNQPTQVIADMAIDKQGNIITLGTITGVQADMDPSPAVTDTSFSEFGSNYFFSKISPSGKLIYIKYFKKANGTPFILFTPRRILVDNNNDIVIAADFYGKVDFNPASIDSANLTSFEATYPDMAIAKYTNDGIYQWAFNIKGNSSSSTKSLYASMTLASNNDIVVNTQLTGTVDVDPGTNVVNAISGTKGCVLLGYSSTGAYKWHTVSPVSTSYGASGFTSATDSLSNAYYISVGGYASTIYKASVNGSILWNKTIGTGVYPYTNRTEISAIYANKKGDFVVHGSFINLMNFNLNGGYDTVRSATGLTNEYFIAGYTSNGLLLWKKTFPNTVLFGKGFFDNSGNYHCVGSIKNDLIFDGVTIKGGVGTNGAFYAKFSPTGTLLNASGLGVLSTYGGILPSNNNSFLAFGNITGTVDIDATSGVLNLSSTYSNSFTAFYGSAASNGLSGQSNLSPIKVYPIPANESLNLELGSREFAEFEIYSVSGAKLSSGVVQQGIPIDVKELANGYYFLKLKSNEMILSQAKFCIQK